MNAHRIARLLYVLVFLAAAPLSADEGEPNDKREQASPAEINRAVAGSLDDRVDRDWYRIDVPSAGDVYAEVITATGDYVAVDVRFYDTNGKPLGDYGLWLDAPATVFVEIVPYGDDWFPPPATTRSRSTTTARTTRSMKTTGPAGLRMTPSTRPVVRVRLP